MKPLKILGFRGYFPSTLDIRTTVSTCVEAVKQIPERLVSALVEL